jgi:RHS repeat-associated protein
MAGSAALAKKSGYCYIYITNESNDLVYFDNFTLAHERSSLMEETHYYPFGLTMAGISSKAAGKLENRFKFNEGTELNSSLDINLYETDWRLYDPQLGRFHQLDRLGEINASVSGFVFASNNPISINDPTGLTDNNPKTDTFRVVGTTTTGEEIYNNGQELNGVEITQNTRDKKNPGVISFYSNVSLFRYRYNNNLPLVQEHDRQSYLDGLESGSILRTVARQEDAEQFERDVYAGLATMLSLPFEVPALVGLVAKGRQFTTVFMAVNRHYSMKTAVSVSLKSVRAGSFTRSTAALGRSTHNMYQEMKGAVKVGGDVLKEFKVPGGRIDVLDNATKTIYELKTNNPSEILKGLRQLDKYNQTLGGGYKTVLDLY